MKPDLEIRRACKLLNEYDYSDEAELLDKAPEMARMLLEREWFYDSTFGYVCPECEGRKDQRGHAEDCSWVTMMKAIGAR